MTDMKVIENELVAVYQTSTGEKVVYGTELHATLEVKTPYRTWIDRRFSDCEAAKDKDYTTEQICTLSGGTPKREDIIKLDTAKEIAMLERNEKGKRVRRYFIGVEEKYKEQMIDLDQLAPETKLMNLLVQSISRNELETKRIAAEQKQIKETVEIQGKAIQTVKETFTKGASEQETTQWVNHCITKIAESPNFMFTFGNRYAAARNESYQRLTTKAGCRLDQKVRNAIARAEEKGSTQAQKNNINKLTVIMADRRLKEIYVGVIKEMMIAYCVEASVKGVQA